MIKTVSTSLLLFRTFLKSTDQYYEDAARSIQVSCLSASTLIDRISISKILATFGFLVITLLPIGCNKPATEPSSCDGLSDKTVGITRDDYSACAGEILVTLESLQENLKQLVLKEDNGVKPEAEANLQRLRYLMREVGFQADIYREARGRRNVERWPDSSMRRFNGSVGHAVAQFSSALGHPNEGNLWEGTRHLKEARVAYSYFR